MGEYNNWSQLSTWSQLAEQFNDAVEDAKRTGNYTTVMDLVMDTANNAIAEAKEQTKNVVDDISKEVNIDVQTEIKNKNINIYKTKTITPTGNKLGKVKAVGQVKGILFIIFGGLGLGIECLSFLFMTLLTIFGEASFFGFITNLAVAAGFGYMIYHGCNLLARVKRAMRYAKICGEKMYADITTLASNTGKDKKYVSNDVKKMMQLGMFPNGHLDKQESCLMLNDEIYNTYLELEYLRKELVPEQTQEQPAQTNTADSELEAMMQEGKDYILKIRNLNDQIEGEAISTKLYRMEKLLKDIFWQVKQHPEKREQMQRLMEYYLPTTLKLVEAYAEFDDVSEPDKDMVEAKQQIENTLDTINEAFSELLNNLFRNRVFDVTTDAQVLQTMLAKEGLKKNDFEKQEELLNE